MFLRVEDTLKAINNGIQTWNKVVGQEKAMKASIEAV